MTWQPISTAPMDGSEVLCWRTGWSKPIILIWKTNRRLVTGRANARTPEEKEWLSCRADSYFGDPTEDDDYDFAILGAGPTHWLPYPAFPA